MVVDWYALFFYYNYQHQNSSCRWLWRMESWKPRRSLWLLWLRIILRKSSKVGILKRFESSKKLGKTWSTADESYLKFRLKLSGFEFISQLRTSYWRIRWRFCRSGKKLDSRIQKWKKNHWRWVFILGNERRDLSFKTKNSKILWSP